MGLLDGCVVGNDELACDGFGATGGWGFDCGALSPTTDGFQRKILFCCESRSTCSMSSSAVAKPR